jgi:hypothetical protein
MNDEKLTLEEARAAGLTPSKEVYSVPRRFGIGTIMGVATAYAMLLWGMQQLDWPPVVIIFNGVFLTIIGVMQVVMTKTPRWASMLTGAVSVLGMSLATGYVQRWIFFDPCNVVWVIPGGLIYGYLGGVLVAGVFLVIDKVTMLIAGRSKSPLT